MFPASDFGGAEVGSYFAKPRPPQHRRGQKGPPRPGSPAGTSAGTVVTASGCQHRILPSDVITFPSYLAMSPGALTGRKEDTPFVKKAEAASKLPLELPKSARPAHPLRLAILSGSLTASEMATISRVASNEAEISFFQKHIGQVRRGGEYRPVTTPNTRGIAQAVQSQMTVRESWSTKWCKSTPNNETVRLMTDFKDGTKNELSVSDQFARHYKPTRRQVEGSTPKQQPQSDEEEVLLYCSSSEDESARALPSRSEQELLAEEEEGHISLRQRQKHFTKKKSASRSGHKDHQCTDSTDENGICWFCDSVQTELDRFESYLPDVPSRFKKGKGPKPRPPRSSARHNILLHSGSGSPELQKKQQVLRTNAMLKSSLAEISQSVLPFLMAFDRTTQFIREQVTVMSRVKMLRVLQQTVANVVGSAVKTRGSPDLTLLDYFTLFAPNGMSATELPVPSFMGDGAFYVDAYKYHSVYPAQYHRQQMGRPTALGIGALNETQYAALTMWEKIFECFDSTCHGERRGTVPRHLFLLAAFSGLSDVVKPPRQGQDIMTQDMPSEEAALFFRSRWRLRYAVAFAVTVVAMKANGSGLPMGENISFSEIFAIRDFLTQETTVCAEILDSGVVVAEEQRKGNREHSPMEHVRKEQSMHVRPLEIPLSPSMSMTPRSNQSPYGSISPRRTLSQRTVVTIPKAKETTYQVRTTSVRVVSFCDKYGDIISTFDRVAQNGMTTAEPVVTQTLSSVLVEVAADVLADN